MNAAQITSIRAILIGAAALGLQACTGEAQADNAQAHNAQASPDDAVSEVGDVGDRANAIIDLGAIAGENAEHFPIASDANMIVTLGEGGALSFTDVYASADGRFVVDVSDYDTFSATIRDWPVDEVMVMLEGEVTVTDEDGTSTRFGPGDSFLMRQGFNGTWEQDGPIRKIAVIYRPGE
ncbi:MAG: cupin domain-containing protein [Pacificimonas sp.]|jgi:uncharacterized cupin superfamily protein|nr:cupin domain-containing protein [Pacificimonas sp.]